MKTSELLQYLQGIKGAILDVDGTILDTMKAWDDVDYKYLESLGIEAPPGLQQVFFSLTMDESTKYIKETFQLPFSEEKIGEDILDVMRAFYRDEAQLKSGMAEILAYLKAQNTKMLIVSSSEGDLIKSAFERLELMDYFEEIMTCTAYNTTKSKPWIFRQAAKKLGLEPEDVFVFEDGLYAMKVVKKEGFPVVGFFDASSAHDWEEIQQIADFAVNND